MIQLKSECKSEGSKQNGDQEIQVQKNYNQAENNNM